RPFGRTQPSTTSPTGSGSPATVRRPPAMAATRASVRRRRSTTVAAVPAVSARPTSCVLAARISSARSTTRPAARVRASPFAAAGFDAKVVAQASELGELYSALLGGSVEVVVLGDGISAEDAGPRIKGAWPGTKVVSMGDQAGGAAVGAWAAEPGEVETAILTT